MQPEVRVDSCTSRGTAPERILAPCAGQGLTYNLHEASCCAQPWLQPMHLYAFNPSWGQQQAMPGGEAAVNQQDPASGTTALAAAAASGCTVEARLLLQHGADPNLADNDGNSPLIRAAMASSDAPQSELATSLSSDTVSLSSKKRALLRCRTASAAASRPASFARAA